jgi:3-hydroxymyristoyl/3-hydroxydecanoyl-(acyl carrier protein) dehydratase
VSAFPTPESVLPHHPPFLFVDEVTALQPGQSATGLWRLTGDEWFFAGHFPGRPTLPGVLMCEAIAPTWAMASHISTPGSVGRPGKWPAKNHSSPVSRHRPVAD